MQLKGDTSVTLTTQTRTYTETLTLYIAMELSTRLWKLAMSAGGRTVRNVSVTAGDEAGLKRAVERAQRRFELPEDCRVLVCEEAGRDGFWVHRLLERLGYGSLVIDPSSLRVDRRQRRRKTDRLDAKQMLSELVQYDRYDQDRWSVVKVPSREAEDARRPSRELARLTKERTGHVSRIKGLLATMGTTVATMAQLEGSLDEMRTWENEPLPRELKAEIRRELKRWRLVQEQIREIESQQRQEQKEGKSVAATQATKMEGLKGIGDRTSWSLSTELFSWREFRNRKEVGACLGLCGTPYDSGESSREQGISRAGNARLRGLMIEAAWSWVRWQPESDLTKWFHRRWAGDPRRKKAGIVAVARRLLIQLWHYVEHGVVPKGAILNG